MKVEKPAFLADARLRESCLKQDKRVWNWHAQTTNNKQSPTNYYEASLADWSRFTALEGDLECDVLVVGGGLLGASTALHIAETGLDVILVEKDSIGAAASGRNGGQLTPGLARWEATDMLSQLSFDGAKRLWRFASVEAMDLIDQIADRYGFSLDRQYGHITAAVHPGHINALVESADARVHLGDDAVSIIGAYELEEYVNSPLYYGASLDAIGGQLHPLALLRGLVYGLIKNGGRVFEETEILEVEDLLGESLATTARGAIRARKAVVLAVHNTSFRFLSGVNSTTAPFYTYVGVTPPLDNDMAVLLPKKMPVYDTQFQIDYYRPVRDNRLLFGGQGTGTCWTPEHVNRYLEDRIRTVFPQLGDVGLEYSWSGISDFTLNGATDCRKMDGVTPVYLVHGWSGHGVAQTVRIGKAISDDLMGLNTDFDMLTKIDHRQMPLGRQLSPVAIPLVKVAVNVASTMKPGKLISF